jgi:hypothetical protein
MSVLGEIKRSEILSYDPSTLKGDTIYFLVGMLLKTPSSFGYKDNMQNLAVTDVDYSDALVLKNATSRRLSVVQRITERITQLF